jgi:hypothetical protein
MFALITPRANCTTSKKVEYVPARRSIFALLIGAHTDHASPGFP